VEYVLRDGDSTLHTLRQSVVVVSIDGGSDCRIDNVHQASNQGGQGSPDDPKHRNASEGRLLRAREKAAKAAFAAMLTCSEDVSYIRGVGRSGLLVPPLAPPDYAAHVNTGHDDIDDCRCQLRGQEGEEKRVRFGSDGRLEQMASVDINGEGCVEYVDVDQNGEFSFGIAEHARRKPWVPTASTETGDWRAV